MNLTTILHCELNTLPYPKAALFGFCVALAAGNVLAFALALGPALPDLPLLQPSRPVHLS